MNSITAEHREYAALLRRADRLTTAESRRWCELFERLGKSFDEACREGDIVIRARELEAQAISGTSRALRRRAARDLRALRRRHAHLFT